MDGKASYPGPRHQRNIVQHIDAPVSSAWSSRSSVRGSRQHAFLDSSRGVDHPPPASSHGLSRRISAPMPNLWELPGQPSASSPQSRRTNVSSSLGMQARSSSQQPANASPEQTSGSDSINKTTVAGVLLGVAAGAALTYAMISSGKEEPSDGEIEDAPDVARRVTIPERPVPNIRSQKQVQTRPVDIGTRRMVSYPPVSGKHHRSNLEPSQQTLAQGGSQPRLNHSTSNNLGAVPRSQAADGHFTSRRRSPSRNSSVGQAPRARASSETPISRTPWPLSDVGRRNHKSSPRSLVNESRSPPITRSRQQSHEAGQKTHAPPQVPSHRSRRGLETTAPAPVLPPLERNLLARAPTRSRASHSSRAAGYTRAGEIPLPPSSVGSSHAAWDDDLDSIAPSDSISCVGSKSSKRRRRKRH